MPRFATERAQLDPTGFALVDGDRELTWQQVGDSLNRCANLLLAADANGELGDAHRIAVFAENAAETALAHLGGLLAGASSVPVNFHLTASEAAYILADSGSKVLFVGPETAERGLAAAREVGVPVVIGWGCRNLAIDGVADIVDWQQWLAGGDPADPPTTVVPRPNLLYTSGTTGQPKGTELPPTMFAGGVDMDEHLALHAQGSFSGFGTHLVVGPMYHTGPLKRSRQALIMGALLSTPR